MAAEPAAEQQVAAPDSRPTSRQKAPDGADGQSLISAVPVLPGRLTGAYDVQKAVGKGGYAVVYKAVRQDDGRVVAIKKVEVREWAANTAQAGGRCLHTQQHVAAHLDLCAFAVGRHPGSLRASSRTMPVMNVMFTSSLTTALAACAPWALADI